MSNKQGKEIPWWAIVLGFMIFPPIGFILLFLSLGDVRIPTDRIEQEFRNTYYQQQRRRTPPAGAEIPLETRWRDVSGGQSAQKAAKKAEKKAKKTPSWVRKLRSGKLMTAIGSICSFIFSIGLVAVLTEEGSVAAWFSVLGFLCASLYMMGKGISQTRLSRRQRLYMGVIGQRKSIFLTDLAGAAGVSVKRATRDIQDMLAEGILPMGYIDMASGRLVLTEEGYQPPEPKAEAQEEPAKTEADDNALLRQIKEINDAIPGEEMSRKIDRIGEITGRILDYQRRNPAKAPELRQFLNYYLPTTLRLLKTYAQLDAQGVDGANINASKQRIEGMMDKVVEGFEKQLDQLFQTDAMDIATDVEVLERMLEKDGLGSGGMTMGG